MYVSRTIGILVLLAALGCAHTGQRMERSSSPTPAPQAAALLGELRAQAETVRAFTATGKFVLDSPDLSADYVLPQSSLYFRAPDRVAVAGRKYGGYNVVNLVCVGEAFLLELPTENKYAYRPQGESVEGVQFRVSPADIVREAFIIEDWSSVSPSGVRVQEDVPSPGQVTLELRAARSNRVQRRVVLDPMEGRWVVTLSERFDENGALLARTERSNFVLASGLPFPLDVVCVFPGPEARLEFHARKYLLNPAQDATLYDLEAARRRVQARGYAEWHR